MALNVAGIDEVGRGAFFGPVFASSVCLSKEAENKLIKLGLKDSKKLSSKKRDLLFPMIKSLARCWSLGQASAREIDMYGIRVATEKAMIRAVEKMEIKPDLLLIDGNLPLRLWDGNQETIIKGEDKFPSIAAASVLAKVSRDILIKRLAILYPFYQLEKNVGYGTTYHRNQIISRGTTKLHRQSFLSRYKHKN